MRSNSVWLNGCALHWAEEESIRKSSVNFLAEEESIRKSSVNLLIYHMRLSKWYKHTMQLYGK